MSDDGQVSEVQDMRPDGAAPDDPPGADDGIPPADATRHEVHGGPREYGEGVMGDE